MVSQVEVLGSRGSQSMQEKGFLAIGRTNEVEE